MSEFTSEQCNLKNNVKLSMDISVSDGCNKLELISSDEMEYKQCLPFALVRARTQIWRHHGPFTNSLDLL